MQILEGLYLGGVSLGERISSITRLWMTRSKPAMH